MMNFEDEDFDFAEGFLDEVLPPSRVPSGPAGCASDGGVGCASDGGVGAQRGGFSVPAVPAAASRPDDPGGFSCTPDSVSVSQMFGLRTNAAAFPVHSAPPAAPAAPAAPASPGLSTADPFADDDLMDADLLDACEAAEATPAAADLPTVSAERPGSRGMLNGAGSGARDMLDDIAMEPRDVPSRSAAAKTPSRDTASGRFPDLGACDTPVASASSRPGSRSTPVAGAFPGSESRDTCVAGASSGPGSRDAPVAGAFPGSRSRDTCVAGAFPGSGSRDTPASSRRPAEGSRVGGRRSAGSAVKRRFPGPAGILPITGSLLTLAHEVSLQEDDLTAAGEEDDPSLYDPVSESQLSQPEEAAAWESGPWRRLQAELRTSPADPDGLLRRINMSAIRRAAAANQLRKVPLLAALLQTLEPTSDLSYQATFRDPTGQMDGTVAKDAFEHCGAALRPGCVLVLRDVVVWRESARRLYLSVTRRSLVYLFPETPSGADAASVVQISELSAAELAAARLVEEPPEVAVLHESPPPSPPRPQLYPTPQVGGGGGGGGGRGWRGGGGRSWRGRGAGETRSSPYNTPRRGGGSGAGGGSPAYRTPAAASPAAREAVTASPALRTAPTAGRAAAAPRSADGRPTAAPSPLFSAAAEGPRAAARAASPALRPYTRPAAAPAPAAVRQNQPAPAAAPRPPPPAAKKHKSDAISAAEIDAMFDDDDDVLFGQL